MGQSDLRKCFMHEMLKALFVLFNEDKLCLFPFSEESLKSTVVENSSKGHNWRAIFTD